LELLWMFHSFLKEVHTKPVYGSFLQRSDERHSGTAWVG
jgi:hypothetical protein